MTSDNSCWEDISSKYAATIVEGELSINRQRGLDPELNACSISQPDERTPVSRRIVSPQQFGLLILQLPPRSLNTGRAGSLRRR